LKQYGQNNSHLVAELNTTKKTLVVQQEIIFFNPSQDTLTSLVLNDWNNAYSSKTTPLAKRFSDEFYRGFHLARADEFGSTTILSITDTDKFPFVWKRTEKNPDLIVVDLKRKLAPNEKITIQLSYIVKIPNNKFTKYGYGENNKINLKNWFLTPSRYENHAFITYNNNNLDDIANGICNFDIELKIPKNLEVTSDLNTVKKSQTEDYYIHELSGKNRTDFSLFLESKSSFYSYKNGSIEVVTNIKDSKLDDIQKAIIVDRVVNFTNDLIGKYPYEKITVSQADYERNPFYGLNQLPSFISPFSDEFIFEIKFLKTYLNNYLKNSLKLDPRKDNWIYDGIQIHTMMKYIDENYPESKMLGWISNIRLLKSYKITHLGFNEQYNYFYTLMARKNLDQPLGNPKNTLIKFNEQIASKYRAGLSFKFLSDFLGDNSVNKSISEFYKQNKERQTSRTDFENLLKTNANKDINWFFKTIIDSRELIDYKFLKVYKTEDSIYFSLKNKNRTNVPISAYGLNKGNIVFKKWLNTKNPDSIFSFERKDADKIVLNYENEVPEYNLRNNWKKLEGFFPNNRPMKFVFMKDLEDPYYNQILYVPTLGYNFYDGFSPGIRLHNNTILDKPFIFELNPAYATKSNSIIGAASFALNQNYRNNNLYNIRYSASSSYFHYAPDASYLKLNPMIQMHIRQENFRDNRKQLFVIRHVMVDREKSDIVLDNTDENYSIFNLKYYNTRTEVVNHVNFVTDIQVGNKFGKASAEMEYRKLLKNNRQVNFRLYLGSFLYKKTTSDFFSFALDRPTDYLFDYNYFGRSESAGLFSQQFIMSEGGFKSKLDNPYANQWITAFNASCSIWNWVEVYGDLGLIKNNSQKEKFVYDSGIRLNLATNYFELFFPFYSNNGWEITQKKYSEKIRFIITFNPRTLLKLFTRKWF
jgi:hypothetical protein